MKQYYFIDGDFKVGPLSLEELSDESIFRNTLVWREGLADWIAAGDFPELIDKIKDSPPPVPIEEENNKPRYDYSEIEDKAGVEYSYATVFTGSYIALNLFAKPYLFVQLEVLIATVLVVLIWNYFKKYFDSQNDVITGKWIAYIMGAYVVFGLLNLYILNASWGESLTGIIWEWWNGSGSGYKDAFSAKINIIMLGLFGSMLTIFIVGFRVIQVNNNYPFPLKRIAISAMILAPISMLVYLFERAAIYMSYGYYESQVGLVGNLILLLPYLFLLQHFYKADRDDQTA